MIDYECFGQEIYRIRQSFQYSRDFVYSETGITKETQRNLEYAKRKPSLATLEVLSYFYKTDLLELLINCRTKGCLFSDDLIKDSNDLFNQWDPKLHETMCNYLESYQELSLQSPQLHKITQRYLELFNNMKANNFRFALENSSTVASTLVELSQKDKTALSDPRFFNIELIFASVYTFLLRKEGDYDRADYYVSRCIDYLEDQEHLTRRQCNILGAFYINKATIFHRKSDHEAVLNIIEQAFKSKHAQYTNHIISSLLTRKIVSLNYLDSSDYRVAHLITTVLLLEEGERYKLMVHIFKNQYKIKHPLYDAQSSD